MKKITFIMVCLFCSLVMFAQEEVKKAPKKDYAVFLPKAGTIALGADAAQFVRFLGAQTFGRINATGNVNSPVAGYQGDIFGKYFISDKLALRASLSLDFVQGTQREFVRDDYKLYNNPYSDELTVDVNKYKHGEFNVGVGTEYRRSLWRLQGYIGGGLFIGYGYVNNNFEYGNNITDFNQNPTTYNFGANIPNNPNGFPRDYYRVLSTKTTSTLNYGGAVFTGVDYFFSRNVSLGLEFGYQAKGSYTGETWGTVEQWANNRLETKEELIRPTQKAFVFRPFAHLNLMFYF